MLLYLLVVSCWIVLGLSCKRIATIRGLDPTIWFFAGFFLGVLALIAVSLWPVKKPTPAPKPRITIPPQLSRSHWYYLTSDGRQLGPLSLDGMRRAFREGNLTDQSYIWTDGMAEWQHLEDHLDLSCHLTQT